MRISRLGWPTIDDEFPGGNISIVSVEEDRDTLTCRPDLRDTEGYWFYWQLRVSGPSSRAVRIRFDGEPIFSEAGPALSEDDGKTWRWVGSKHDLGDAESITVPPLGDHEVWRWSNVIPYVGEDLDRFVRERADIGVEYAEDRTPVLKIPSSHDVVGETAVLVTARHHACESMASYAVEGFVDEARRIRAMVREAGHGYTPMIVVVPFVDRAGVEAGDQGKNRRPHDHNRDYGRFTYPGVRVVRDIVHELAEHRHLAAIDLHCPYLLGDCWNNHVYVVGEPWPTGDVPGRRLAAELAQVGCDAIPVRDDPYLAHGTAWNSLTDPVTCSGWMRTHSSTLLASTIEIPYAVVDGVTITPGAARRLGASICSAVMETIE